jgi:hypothetical protein
VVELPADRLRFGGREFGVVVQEEESCPGGVQLPGGGGQQAETDPLDCFHPVLDFGVVAVEAVDEPHLPGAGYPGKARWSGMFVATIW